MLRSIELKRSFFFVSAFIVIVRGTGMSEDECPQFSG
jgi:hypothetical protein